VRQLPAWFHHTMAEDFPTACSGLQGVMGLLV